MNPDYRQMAIDTAATIRHEMKFRESSNQHVHWHRMEELALAQVFATLALGDDK